MEASKLKIAVPMAGLGTRMRPHTWSKPKPLIQLAGKTVLDYVLEQFRSVPDPKNVEYVFIVGPQGEQVRGHMEASYPETTVHYVLQAEMRGQSDALWLAREHLQGPMLMTFSDTLIDADLSFLKDETSDVVALVKEVPDPRRFGVAEVGPDGWVKHLVEKPKSMENNLVLIGFYYFRRGEDLISAIEEQMHRNVTLKGEFFLTDAINIMLERGARMRTHRIDTWLDAGTIDSLLETNSYLLHHGYDNSAQAALRPGVAVIPPVFIHEDAQLEACVVGPNVSLAAGCTLKDVIVRDSILEDGTQVQQMILEHSLLGQNVQIHGQTTRLNLGDNSWAVS